MRTHLTYIDRTATISRLKWPACSTLSQARNTSRRITTAVKLC